MKTNQIMHDVWTVTTDKGKYVGMIRSYQVGPFGKGIVYRAFLDGKQIGEPDTLEEAEKLFEA